MEGGISDCYVPVVSGVCDGSFEVEGVSVVNWGVGVNGLRHWCFWLVMICVLLPEFNPFKEAEA